jgi:hypothetical protein
VGTISPLAKSAVYSVAIKEQLKSSLCGIDSIHVKKMGDCCAGAFVYVVIEYFLEIFY